MYHIFKDGTELGATERLTHVKQQTNGVPIIHADGDQIVYGGEIYNVDGQPHVGEYDTVIAVWKDDALVTHEENETIESQVTYTAMMTDTVLGA